MKNSKVLTAILIMAGLVAAVIGAEILFMPRVFYTGYGVELGGNLSLLNEMKASGGVLLASGILIMAGAFIIKLRFTATLVSTLIYLSYGLSRVMSIGIDGMPDGGLIQAAFMEIMLGLVSFFALLKYRED